MSTDALQIPFVVLVDSREQLPYSFAGLRGDVREGRRPLAIRTEVVGLNAGDYSIAGCETEIAIERKSLADLYHTLGQERRRFEDELERLNALTWAAVVVEATWPEIACDPPQPSRMNPKSVVRSIYAFSMRYPRVHWFPIGERRFAEAATFRLLQRFHFDRQRTPQKAGAA